MSRTALLQGRTRKRDGDLVEEDGLESEDIIDDPAIARDAPSRFLTCGQSIVFSPTFQVPVFYFTVHDSRAYPQMTKSFLLKGANERRRFSSRA
jgi:ubiquitin-like-conjugating enzyme ATG10